MRLQHAATRKSGVKTGRACRLVEAPDVACAYRLQCACMLLYWGSIRR